MKKENRAHQAQAKEVWPPKSSYVSQATSKMTDEIKELLHDTINIGVENNRMLKWLVVRKRLDYLSHDLEHNDYRDEYKKPILDQMFRLGEKLPEIHDIFGDVEKK